MENLILAYLGDAVYELFIRENLIKQNLGKLKDIQKESQKYVTASSQVKILEYLINKNILTDEEIQIINRGRNSKSHKSKSCDIITYKKSTGFECLIGYLYLNNKDRLNVILKEVLQYKC